MFKRIFSAVLVVVLGFVAVLTVVVWQLRRLDHTVRTLDGQDMPISKVLVLSEEIAKLEQIVGRAFLASRSGDLADARSKVREPLERMSVAAVQLGGDAFVALRSKSVIVAEDGEAPPPGEKSSDRRDDGAWADLSFGEITSQLRLDVEGIRVATEESLRLAERRMTLGQELATSREDLSRVYRKSFPLGIVDDRAFGVMSRAVLVVLFSESVRDINFVGRARFKEALGTFEKARLTDDARTMLAELKKQFEKTLEMALQSGADSTDHEFFQNKSEAIQAKLGVLRRFAERELKIGYEQLSETTKQTIRVSIMLAVITILLGSGIAYRMARGMARRLGNVAAQLDHAAVEISGAADLLQNSSGSVAHGSSEQAASIERAGASLEQMSSMTRRNTDSAQAAKTLAAKTRESADAGLGRVSEMARTLGHIDSAVGEMETTVREMQASSHEVAKIVKTIDEIAFQTNLLALNAAVEAARAGEAGMGFAVVADEVRSLAQRSAHAARDTAEKIEAAVRRSELGGAASRKVVESLSEVRGCAGTIQQDFQGIAGQIKSLDELVGAITSATREQAQGIREVSDTVSRMDGVMQQNVATARENAGAAEHLGSQASALRDVVFGLQAIVGAPSEESSDTGGSENPSPMREMCRPEADSGVEPEMPDGAESMPDGRWIGAESISRGGRG